MTCLTQCSSLSPSGASAAAARRTIRSIHLPGRASGAWLSLPEGGLDGKSI